ncbi:MAG: hypothetical protein WDN10_02360 [bacterium]
MKFGFKETREYLSSFTWFERKQVRNENQLSDNDLKYIKGWTISPFGYGYIAYISLRKLPDILIVYVITYLYFEVTDKLINTDGFEGIWTLFFGLLTLAMFLASLFAIIFTFRHGRRLSWNRGRYVYSRKNILNPKLQQFESVDELRKSERRYINFSVVPTFILLAVGLGLLGFIAFL